MKRSAALLVAVAALAAAAIPAPAAAQAAAGSVILLDVPFMPQSEALCGGAAAAMVMRFWGAREVYADSFAALVNRDAGGIHTGDLVRDLASRGWAAAATVGDPATARQALERRQPVIALIEDRPGRFHYVVLVGWTDGRVVFHDPARAPFRVIDEAGFLRSWDGAGNWMLMLRPTTATSEPAAIASRDAPSTAASPCDAMVEEGVRRASAAQVEEARALLQMAAQACPESSAPWRELAGLASLAEDWAGAEAAAREAVRRDARDAHAARILATASFLQDRPDAALAAWNTLGEPLIDMVDVKGLDRMRYDVVAHALGLEPRTLLTPAALRKARRRLSELPGSMQSRVTFRPAEGSSAIVDAAVVERPFLPFGATSLAAIGIRALTDREIAATIGSPTGGGDAIAVAWRWWEARPRVGVSYAAPAPAGLGAVWTVEAFTERQTYRIAASDVRERRDGAALRVSDWVSGDVRWEAGIGVDRWNADVSSVSFTGAIEHHAAGERLVTGVSGSIFAGGLRTVAGAASVSWRSAARRAGDVWTAGVSLDVAGEEAPLALWSGAGAGHGRPALLRAHPLLDDGVIVSPAFGRRLVAGGAEWRYWFPIARRPLQIAPAVFVDAAKAYRGVRPRDEAGQVDAGAGVRLAAPFAGVLRIDYAHGLRDGANAWSIGWTR